MNRYRVIFGKKYAEFSVFLTADDVQDAHKQANLLVGAPVFAIRDVNCKADRVADKMCRKVLQAL
jgi:hypothetical protein